MAEPFTIYKLTILYMLDKADFPLSNTQLTGFFLDMDYTDYFRVQEVISNLVDAGLITEESTHSNTQYSLSPAGRESLGFFQAKISEGIEQDVKAYFDKNKWELQQENSCLADYRRTKNYNYDVTCQIRSDGETILHLNLTVKNKEQAEAICRNWKDAHFEVYDFLMDQLLH